MTRDPLPALAADAGLAVLGHVAVRDGDPVPAGAGQIALLGPAGPAFWERFSASPEAADAAPDPMDRWSLRVIGGLAASVGGKALFPFGGPPWPPFIDWALRGGTCFLSPVGLLVHERHGLFVSFRGAIARPGQPDETRALNPCETCKGRPCRTACPVGALGPEGYDVPACRRFLDTADGRATCARGCQVRRACPVGAHLRPAPQSAFHMAAFHGE